MPKTPPPNLQRLLPRHHKILELCLDGLSSKDIAQITGLTTQSISNITNSPLFQDALSGRREVVENKVDQVRVSTTQEAQRMLEEKAKEAVQVHIGLLDSSDERVKQSSANSILDRVFSKKGEGSGAPTIVLPGAQLNILSLAVRESRKNGEDIIDG